jgi:hypothetical protein
MKQPRLTGLLLILFSLSQYAYGQYTVKGIITDAKRGEPLAFVNIIFNHNPHWGTTTDIDGKFSFTAKEKITALTCSYIGYKTLDLTLEAVQAYEKLHLQLTPSEVLLEEITINAGENPAHRIIRKTIENKELNDPENISSFRCSSYNKTVYDFRSNDTVTKNGQLEIDSVLKGGHLMVLESVTERRYIRPGKSEEIVTGTKISGFKHPTFATLATDVQPFSFYKDVIPILDINYLNPISRGSIHKYYFNLSDTLYQDGDTVFVISYKPLAGKNYEGLTGLLYINTRGFAVQNVIAEPYEKGFIDIKIQQQYAFIDGKHWFPIQLNFELKIKSYPSPETGLSMNGKSYIDHIELNAPLKRKDFSQVSLHMDDAAGERDSSFWTAHRPEALNKKENLTYRVIDSLGKEIKSDEKLKILEKLAQNKIPVKFLDIDLSQTLVVNKFENYRLGLGVYTNEKVFKRLVAGGFFGYGIKDKQWKYGGDIAWAVQKSHEFEIKALYHNTLQETGRPSPRFFDQNYFGLRNLIASQMDMIQRKSISAAVRIFRDVKLGLSLNHTVVLPQYVYAYQLAPDRAVVEYTTGDMKLDIRYAYHEKIIETFNRRVSEGTRYPVFCLAYTKGIKGFYNSQFDYNKVEVRIEQSFYTRSLGQTSYRLEGGYVDRPLPYGLLFTGEGGFDKNKSFIFKNYFQTMRPYEFLSDQYVNLFFSHNFGSLLFKTKKFKPGLTVQQNMGWGMLSSKEKHQFLAFDTKEKGYYESGLVIDNLVRLNYLNVAYIGVGCGVYYRYGPYALDNEKDNLTYKLSITFTTK